MQLYRANSYSRKLSGKKVKHYVRVDITDYKFFDKGSYAPVLLNKITLQVDDLYIVEHKQFIPITDRSGRLKQAYLEKLIVII